MIVYSDTSFLASYFSDDDANHSAALATFGKFAAEDLVICEVHLLELPAAMRASTLRAVGAVPAHIARRVINRFDRALSSEVFIRKNVSMTDSISMARSLGETHGWKARHTAFDLWHLAAAWSLSAGVFLTFDKRQAAIARLLGMMT